MRMTEEKFWLLKKLEKVATRKEIAKVVGIKDTSVSQYKRFNTWDEYTAYKKELLAKVKKNKKPVQVKLDFSPPKSQLDLILDKLEEIMKQFDDLNAGVASLVGWEEKKQAQKEDYWAKQSAKKSYFNRFTE